MITVLFEGLCAIADRRDGPWTVVAPIGTHPHKPLLIARGSDLDIAPARFTWWPDYAFLGPAGKQLCVWSLARTSITVGATGTPRWAAGPHGGVIDFSTLCPGSKLVPSKGATGATVLIHGGTAKSEPRHEINVSIAKDGNAALFSGLATGVVRWEGHGASDGAGEYIEGPLGRIAFRRAASPLLVVSNTSPTADSANHFECYYDVVAPTPPKPWARLTMPTHSHTQDENAESGINCIPNLRFDL